MPRFGVRLGTFAGAHSQFVRIPPARFDPHAKWIEFFFFSGKFFALAGIVD